MSETIAVLDLDVPHHVELGDGALELRIDDRLESEQNGVV